MKVRLYGMQIQGTKGVPLQELIAHLRTLQQRPIEWEGANRIFAVDVRGPFFVGVAVTVRDKKTFYAMTKNSSGEITLDVESLGTDKSIVDVNFFLIHQTTGRGIYSHYWHSLGLWPFLRLLRAEHARITQAMIARREAEGDGQARQRLDGTLGIQQIMTQQQLTDRIAELEELTEATFVLSADAVNIEGLRPFGDLVRSATIRVLFKAEVRKGDQLKGALASVVAALRPESGSATGKSEGIKRDVDFDDDKYLFAEWDYDQLAERLAKLRLNAIGAHVFMADLLIEAESRMSWFVGATTVP